MTTVPPPFPPGGGSPLGEHNTLLEYYLASQQTVLVSLTEQVRTLNERILRMPDELGERFVPREVYNLERDSAVETHAALRRDIEELADARKRSMQALLASLLFPLLITVVGVILTVVLKA